MHVTKPKATIYTDQELGTLLFALSQMLPKYTRKAERKAQFKRAARALSTATGTASTNIVSISVGVDKNGERCILVVEEGNAS